MPTDLPIDQSDRGISSMSFLFPGDSGLCQVEKNLAQLFPKIHVFVCNQSFFRVNTRRENQQPWQPSAFTEARNGLHFQC